MGVLMTRAWWRFEIWTNPRWGDGWKRARYWTPRVRRMSGPPPRAVEVACARTHLLFWYRDIRHPELENFDGVGLDAVYDPNEKYP